MLLISVLASSKMWTVLARLTYSVYLIHCVIINAWLGSMQREQPYSWLFLVNNFGGVLWWSYILGAVVFVAVEAPFGALVKLIK